MVVCGDKGQPIELTRRYLIKPTSRPVSLNEAKRNNHEIVQIDS